jgi:hypothetical protein
MCADSLVVPLSAGYGMPDGFCFDLPRCTDEPMLFDPKLDGFNIPARTNEFMQHLHDQAAIMQGATELLVLAGDGSLTAGQTQKQEACPLTEPMLICLLCFLRSLYCACFSLISLAVFHDPDFNYASAQQYFKNFEILMDSVNKNGTFRMFYSTPREYVRARNKQQLASSQPSTMTGVKSRSRSQRHVDASTSAVAAPAAGLSWPLKQYSDLFPYSNDDYSYWNGFLVSRPALKMLTRRTSGLLHAVRQLYFLAGRSTSDQQNNPGLQRLREAVAVAQHHDAVTGTSMQHVACDYARRMAEGWTDTAAELQAFLPSLLTKPGGTPPPRGMQTCPLLNISICAASQSNTQGDLAVLLYNGLARNRTELVQVPLPSSPGPSPSAWIVLDSTMQQVPSQVVAQDPSAPGREANISAMNVLVFRATVPAMGATTYFLKLAGKTAPQEPEQSATEKLDAAAALVSISNEYLSLSFDSASGLLVSVSVLQALDGSELHLTAHERNPVHQTTTPLSQDFFMYTPVQNVEVTRGELQNSGAYIFRPNASVPLVAIRDSPSRNVSLSSLQKGPIVQQLTQTFSSWCHQSVRLVAGEPFAHFDWSVGEIPIESGWGGEVVTRYTAPKIASNATWLTDSNGREMQRRVRFQRPDYKLNVTEPVAGEFYPVTTVASISDSVSEMVVLVDRAQGVTSLLDGQLEFMIHRRLLADDDRGVHEALNETAFMSPYPNAVRSGPGLAITGSHQLVLAPAGGAASAIHRPLAARNHMALLQLVQPLAAAGLTAQSYAQKFRTSFASMAPRTSLPVNVELMTLEARVPPTSELTNQVEGPAGGSVLLRLAHQFGVRDHPVLSKPVEVDLALLFAGRPFASITEMSLSGVRPLAEQPAQLVWHVRGESAEERASLAQQRLDARPPLRGSVVTLAPLQIRTFNISFAEPSHLAQPLPAAVETPILRRKAPSAAAGAQPHKHRRSSGKVHIVSEV